MGGDMKSWFGSQRWRLLASVVALALIAAAYFVGKGSVDTHSVEVSDLQAELKSTKGQLASVEGELSVSKGEAEVANEEVAEAEEELAAERSFKGGGEKQNAAAQEYNTDFPWSAAGRAGEFTFKPVGWEQQGEKWILTVEAKNEGHEPKQPFCGGSESVVVDAAENQYSGEAVLEHGSASCGEELQPGLTLTYKAEFKIPSNAVPVAIAIYGEYEQEEEAKTWELPH